jgi:hypothetical protein
MPAAAPALAEVRLKADAAGGVRNAARRLHFG